MTWEKAYGLLADNTSSSDPETICAAITRLGKPFDPVQAKTASVLVSKHLCHANFLVRYQAVWFLGCWGKFREYLSLIVEAAQSDEEVANRAFAARCAGQILKSNHDAKAIKALLHMATDEREEPDVRLAAYSALLYAYYGTDGKSRAREFEPTGDKAVTDFDLAWLSSLPQWAEGLETGMR